MTADNLPDLYTDRDLARARRRGKFVGWIQGGGAVVAVGVIYNLIGWIPTIAVLTLVAYGVYRLVRGSKTEDAAR